VTSGAGSRETDLHSRLRQLPSVEELASRLVGVPHAQAVGAARAAIDAGRESLRAGEPLGDLEAVARRLARPHLRRVINATGVIVHTNLGRAPLPPSALAAVASAGAGYSNLEYDLEEGARGSRQAHVASLLRELTGAEDAIVVNNCAGAVLLAAAALAGGRELIVSRGQLVEIGGSFRIPDVVAQSGARLVEVGTTNRTRAADYSAAIGPETGALMRAHQSNFRTVGFVEEVEIEELCALGVPVIDDVGSGALATGVPIAACRRHPLTRALRIDKLSLAALEATLRLYRDPAAALREVPVLRMLVASGEQLAARAEAMRAALEAGGLDAGVIRAGARVGGGALPLLELEGPVCAVDPGALSLDELTRRLRAGDPPVIGRARDGWLLLDPRTLDDASAEAAVGAVLAATR
jgi:L-seryl-tRNA(Ser) seleniumtransferase